MTKKMVLKKYNVTITVTDADGVAINGATVTYTIKEKENGINNFLWRNVYAC